MDNQSKKLLLGICGFILLITVVIGGILGFKHYLKSQNNLDNKEITKKIVKL